MKLHIIDKKYGCFRARILCECGRTLTEKDFSWDRDRIGIGEKEIIIDKLVKIMERDKINYCATCGKEIEIN